MESFEECRKTMEELIKINYILVHYKKTRTQTLIIDLPILNISIGENYE